MASDARLAADAVTIHDPLLIPLLLAQRREQLCKQTPPCPKCGEVHQIQLQDWLNKPAKWRCRPCGHKWSHEPE